MNRKKIAILFELNMASILYRLKRYNEANSYYDKVLERDAESLDALVNKGHALNHLASEGHALYRLKRYDEANSYYDKALKQTTGYSLLSNSSSVHM